MSRRHCVIVRNTMRRTTSKVVRKRVVLATLLALTVQLIVACTPRPVAGRFYVVIEPTETGRFLDAVVSMTKDMGLRSTVSDAARGSGNPLNVIVATNRSVRLYGQNVPLSGNEDPSLCGTHRGPHSDPAQFVIRVNQKWGALNSEAAENVTRDIFAKLELFGYAVSEDPAICGLAALAGSLPGR
jgi:hypothetical protein